MSRPETKRRRRWRWRADLGASPQGIGVLSTIRPMATFSYTARNGEGERVTGTVIGASRQAVLAELASRRLAPVAVEEVRERQLLRRRVSARQLATAYRQAKRSDDAKRAMAAFRRIKKAQAGAAVPAVDNPPGHGGTLVVVGSDVEVVAGSLRPVAEVTVVDQATVVDDRVARSDARPRFDRIVPAERMAVREATGRRDQPPDCGSGVSTASRRDPDDISPPSGTLIQPDAWLSPAPDLEFAVCACRPPGQG